MSTKTKAVGARRQPVQRRAIETRNRILEAAAQVFANHGYSAGTTNRIADAASISIGSLYQYFPNKDAMLIELMRLHIAAGRERMRSVLVSDDDLSLDELIERSVDAMIDLHLPERALHRVLFEEAPRPDVVREELRAAEDELVEVVERLLVRGGELRARVLVVAIESIVHRLVAGDRPIDRTALRSELIRLVGASRS